jgi:hypothetical protein
MSQREHQHIQGDSSPDSGSVATSFDELAKGLATGAVSRRKALRWMGGALVGATLASVPGVAWANDCRRLGRECRRDPQCCSKNCIRRGDDKVCSCPTGQTRCNDRCVNLKRNERHCGACFNRCLERSECAGGVCRGGCPSGRTLCDDGFCTPNCPSGLTLNTSTCQCEGECPTGQVLCSLQGVCVSNTCPPNQTYDPYFCECECPEGDETCCPDCGGRCCPSPGCYCAVRVDNGSRFCYSGGQSVISCAECGIGEVCVYSGGRPRVGLACVFHC